jgi:hypothetical protein
LLCVCLCNHFINFLYLSNVESIFLLLFYSSYYVIIFFTFYLFFLSIIPS